MNQFKKLLDRLKKDKQLAVPKDCIKTLLKHFPDATNIEWSKNRQNYEVAFYSADMEKIANISSEGVLIDFRIRILAEEIPLPIKTLIYDRGEVMSSILINLGEVESYEIIYRDKSLNRYMIELSQDGTILKEIKL
ncbi:MAG: hypothetical protein ACI83W_002073 [Marinoscillum sp.]|jgi:hypothetical protein